MEAIRRTTEKPVTVILNPTAGGHRQGYWKRMEARFEACFGDLEVLETSHRGHATELARHAVQCGHTELVSCGGDGTLNEVVNGCLVNGVLASPDLKIWVAPGGTATDSVRWLRRNERAGTWVNADLGEVTFTGKNGETERRCFVNVASVGLGGIIAREVDHAPRFLGGRFAFLWAVLMRLPRLTTVSMRVDMDGGTVWNGRSIEVAVANGPYYGGGIPIAPDARFDSGRFDIVQIREVSLLGALRRLPSFYRGRLSKYPELVQYAHGTRIHIETDPPVPLNLDGEAPGMTPATITLLPTKVPLALAPV